MPLTSEQSSLIKAATDLLSTMSNSSPKRKEDHTVASAVLSSTGRIFTGVNMYHFSGGPCAETIAFGNAAQAGVASAFNAGITPAGSTEEETLLYVVAVGDDGRGVINPCGRCRQFMLDWYPGIEVLINDGTEVRPVGIEELLPFCYRIMVQGRAVRKEGLIE